MKPDSLAKLQKALQCQQDGLTDQAEKMYREVLRRDPSQPDALNLLGVLELGRGHFQVAVDWITKAVRVSPKTALYQNNLGVAFKAAGRLAEAAPCFEKAALLQPNLYDAHVNLGAVRAMLGQLDGAIASYEQAVSLNRNPGLLNCLGAAYFDRRDLPNAMQCFDQALALQPDFADAIYNRGRALDLGGRTEEAIAHYEKRARLPNPPPDLPTQLGCLLQKVGRLQEAEASYRRALQTQPSASACNNLATLLEQRFEFAEAEALLREAIRLQPNHENAFVNLGSVLLARGRVEDSVRAYDQAIRLNSGHALAHYNRSHARLASGDFEGGWTDYEYRWQWDGFPTRKPKFPQPEWTGDDLNGRTLLVYNEQGLGDTIQFARYLTLAAKRGGRILFACPEELRSAFAGMAGLSQFIEPGQELPAFDVHAALMSLPRLCGTRYESIPGDVPYLNIPPASRFPLRARTPGRLRVGLVWAGGTRFLRDGLRSITGAHLIPLLRAVPCDYYSLQTGPKSAELKSLPEDIKIEDVGSRLRDFADTASVMGQLDLVISTCTSSLHLAGALARPVWGLLAYAPDWRWLPPRDDSPWYPTLRLFRQATPGDWQGVLKRVEQELTALAGQYAGMV
jgi:tetratricopeptide (TPR) repeat protein